MNRQFLIGRHTLQLILVTREEIEGRGSCGLAITVTWRRTKTQTHQQPFPPHPTPPPPFTTDPSRGTQGCLGEHLFI